MAAESQYSKYGTEPVTAPLVERYPGLFIPSSDFALPYSCILLPTQVESQRVIPRRSFLKIMGASLALVGLAACGAGPNRESATPVTVNPIDYISSELSSAHLIPTLADYANFDTFISAAYMLYVSRTGQGDAAVMSKNSKLGSKAEVDNAFAADKLAFSAGLGPIPVTAKTYGVDGETNKLRIIYNRDSPEFITSVLLDDGNRSKYPDLPRNVLEALLRSALHEPFHFNSPVEKVVKSFQNPDSQSVYNADFAWGLGLYGSSDNQRFSIFGQFDELAAYWLSEQYFGDTGWAQVATDGSKEIQNQGIKLFNKLGVVTKEDILALRGSGKGSIELIERLAAKLNGDKNEAFKRYSTFGNILVAAMQGDSQSLADLANYVENEIPG